MPTPQAPPADAVAAQQSFTFTPVLIRVAVPPHHPALVHRLKPATLHVLGLLADGQPHTRLELAAVGGNRYCARVKELRAAGHRILGPRGWRNHRNEWEPEIEPLDRDGVEQYRLTVKGAIA